MAQRTNGNADRPDPGGRERILFVCHGNICRSPMAQSVMQHLVDEAGLSDRFSIDSAATTREELGNPLYPPARRELARRGVPPVPHRARLITRAEAGCWDRIVCMDDENLRHLRRILGPDNMGRTSLLLAFAGRAGEVADPWYTGDFGAAFRDIDAGCRALLAQVRAERGWVPADGDMKPPVAAKSMPSEGNADAGRHGASTEFAGESGHAAASGSNISGDSIAVSAADGTAAKGSGAGYEIAREFWAGNPADGTACAHIARGGAARERGAGGESAGAHEGRAGR